jgi:hypothetical protein
MKAIVLVLVLGLGITSLPAASNAIDKVQFKGGNVILQPGGGVLMAPREVSFPSSIVIKTNGTYTVGGGRTRTLQEGETLGSDGMLLKPDGTTAPVVDHVTYQRGRVLLFKDGVASEPRQSVTLADGTNISPDGKVTPRTGSPRRLLDGEIFQLSGTALPARDTVTMQNGRVQVQKDGSSLTVEPGRSVMMNDGTKIFGDGRIVKSNGTESKVTEGQIHTLDGVVTRPR